MDKLEVSVNKGRTYFVLPKHIREKHKLEPIMVGKMSYENNQIIMRDFGKTVEMKLDLEEETLMLVRKFMAEEGYGSIDETICNVVNRAFVNSKEHIVYLYPEGFFESKCDLIGDYEKMKVQKRKV